MKSFSFDRLSSTNFLTLMLLGLHVGSILLVKTGGTFRAVGKIEKFWACVAMGEMLLGGKPACFSGVE